MPIGTCRLCHTPNVELKLSHIQPKWLYRRFYHLPNDPLLKTKSPVRMRLDDLEVEQDQEQQKEYMLCDDCEDKFGKRESWFRSQLVDDSKPQPPLSALLDPARQRIDARRSFAGVGKLATDPFVYFILSLFWRAHEYSECDDCRLSRPTAEALRLFLNAGAPLPNTLALYVTFYEQLYIKRPNIQTVFETAWSDAEGHMFTLGSLVFYLREPPVDPQRAAYCLLHAPVKGLIVSSGDWLVERGYRDHAGKVKPIGSVDKYITSRKAAKAARTAKWKRTTKRRTAKAR
jgi:hypothetical protein